MLNRRHLLSTASAALVLPSRLLAADQHYDLILRGGRVIDPAQKFDAIADVAIAGGRIAAVRPNIKGSATRSFDATGKLVVPGLIDIHTHATTDPNGPKLMLADGVMGWIDAGSKGADGIDQAIAAAKASPTLGRVLINIGRLGTAPDGDTLDIKRADVPLAKAAIARNPGFIVGVKARLSKDIAGANDFEALKRAQDVATAFHLPVMIHMGNTVTPLGKLVDLLKPGDIVTHLFAPPPNSIVGDNGKIISEVLAARRRGVWFDVGNGRLGHVRWDVAVKALAQGFAPDTYSTDWTPQGHASGLINMPTIMSNMLSLGASLNQVIASTTVNPTRVFDVFKGRGTLRIGGRANVTVLELRNGSFEFFDTFHNKRLGNQRLFCKATVVGGTLSS